jgi:hypothetical protein
VAYNTVSKIPSTMMTSRNRLMVRRLAMDRSFTSDEAAIVLRAPAFSKFFYSFVMAASSLRYRLLAAVEDDCQQSRLQQRLWIWLARDSVKGAIPLHRCKGPTPGCYGFILGAVGEGNVILHAF